MLTLWVEIATHTDAAISVIVKVLNVKLIHVPWVWPGMVGRVRHVQVAIWRFESPASVPPFAADDKVGLKLVYVGVLACGWTPFSTPGSCRITVTPPRRVRGVIHGRSFAGSIYFLDENFILITILYSLARHIPLHVHVHVDVDVDVRPDVNFNHFQSLRLTFSHGRRVIGIGVIVIHHCEKTHHTRFCCSLSKKLYPALGDFNAITSSSKNSKHFGRFTYAGRKVGT